MKDVKAKKHLGQHFLKDATICDNIAAELIGHGGYKKIIEIGPGMGALTKSLMQLGKYDIHVVDVDQESIVYLHEHFPQLSKSEAIHSGDFLKMDLQRYFGTQLFAVAGNFPYNISTQILFKVLEYRNQVPELVGMFQKEVAERIACPPGSKTYGILSVLLQAYYDLRYCFTVDEDKFIPPPKVKSGVIHLTRNNTVKLDCDEKLFFIVVKTAFNQRRKTLRNSLKSLIDPSTSEQEIFNLRPERLGVAEFVQLTQWIEVFQRKKTN